MIALAHGLGIEVVAEGIETAGQLARLRELVCDRGQGYYYARPQPPDGARGAARRSGARPRLSAAARRPESARPRRADVAVLGCRPSAASAA